MWLWGHCHLARVFQQNQDSTFFCCTLLPSSGHAVRPSTGSEHWSAGSGHQDKVGVKHPCSWSTLGLLISLIDKFFTTQGMALNMSFIESSNVISMRFFRGFAGAHRYYVGRGHILLWPLGKVGMSRPILGKPFTFRASTQPDSFFFGFFLLHESEKMWSQVLTLSCAVRPQTGNIPSEASVSPSTEWSSWAGRLLYSSSFDIASDAEIQSKWKPFLAPRKRCINGVLFPMWAGARELGQGCSRPPYLLIILYFKM